LQENLTLLLDIVFLPDNEQNLDSDAVDKMVLLIEEVSNAGHGVETRLGMCQTFMHTPLGKRLSLAGTKATQRALADFKADKPAADLQAMLIDIDMDPMDVELSDTDEKALESTLATFRDRAREISTLKTLILELPADPIPLGKGGFSVGCKCEIGWAKGLGLYIAGVHPTLFWLSWNYKRSRLRLSKQLLPKHP